MPLVTRITGDCPGCGGKDGFGNIAVHSDAVSRGCLFCGYGYELPLPPLRKTVVYLDQLFFSRAFRENDQKFVAAAARLKALSLRQVLAVPFSTIHEEETHQWRGADGKTSDALMDFIKHASGGHKLTRASTVEKTQLVKAFVGFIQRGDARPPLEPFDVLPRNVHGWTDYIWIDVAGYLGDVERVRQNKEACAKELVALFPEWRASVDDFEGDVADEYDGSVTLYTRAYETFTRRLMAGDASAAFSSPVRATIIEAMLNCFPRDAPIEACVAAVKAFFVSDHFKQIPYQWISVRMLAVLRDRVRRGAYPNVQRAEKALRGFYQDLDHIATYAPYCDAIFIDNSMAEMMRDPRLNLTGRYGTKVFSIANWEAFEQWMASLDAELSPEHVQGLADAYPDAIADPFAVMGAHAAAKNANAIASPKAGLISATFTRSIR